MLLASIALTSRSKASFGTFSYHGVQLEATETRDLGLRRALPPNISSDYWKRKLFEPGSAGKP